MWYVYILQCKDKSLYTGVALDVDRRLKEHRSGKGSKYLRSHLPVKLVYQEPFRGKSSALKREAQIKRWPRRKKQALVEGNRAGYSSKNRFGCDTIYKKQRGALL